MQACIIESLQCVAVCCGVLQCVAVCCGELRCVAVCLASEHASKKTSQHIRHEKPLGMCVRVGYRASRHA